MFDRDNHGESECKQCYAKSAEDHTYCAVHDQAVLDQYHENVKQYDQELAKYNALSETRHSEHDQK